MKLSSSPPATPSPAAMSVREPVASGSGLHHPESGTPVFGYHASTDLQSATAPGVVSAPDRSSHLARLHAMLPRLNPVQRDALVCLQVNEMALSFRSTNREVFWPFVPAPNHPNTEAALKRRASFMLLRPIAADVNAFLDGTNTAQVLKQPLSSEARALLTAQVGALKENAAAVTAAAVEAARVDERYCPIALQPATFPAFLGDQKAMLDALVTGCGNSSSERSELLRMALQSIGGAYLKQAGTLPPGLPTGDGMTINGKDFDHAPFSVCLGNHEESSSVFCNEMKGAIAVVFVGIDDLGTADLDPVCGNPLSKIHVRGFEACSIAEKQAGVFMQKLFIELVSLEEEIHLWKRTGKDGKVFSGTPQ